MIVEAQQARLNETGEERLVDIVSDSARILMRRTVNRLLAAEAAADQAGTTAPELASA